MREYRDIFNLLAVSEKKTLGLSLLLRYGNNTESIALAFLHGSKRVRRDSRTNLFDYIFSHTKTFFVMQ